MILAARGLRNPDGGEEAIEDAATTALLKRVARKIHIGALLLALGLTLAVVLLRPVP